MKRAILENTERFLIDRDAPFYEITIIDKREGISASLTGVDLVGFWEALDGYRTGHKAYGDHSTRMPWDTCLAELCEDRLATANPDYKEWREAAIAAGWEVAERDPSPHAANDRPCLLHKEQDRAMPIGFWKEAVIDLGYDSPQEALEDRAAPAEENEGPAP